MTFRKKNCRDAIYRVYRCPIKLTTISITAPNNN